MDHFWAVVSKNNNLFLSSYVIEEFKHVVARKYPAQMHRAEILLKKTEYTVVHPPEIGTFPPTAIRDPKDYPVLMSAIAADVDVLISGDKDFDPIYIERPEILTISEFLEIY
jgi:predicted nucleic acid-binding protein